MTVSTDEPRRRHRLGDQGASQQAIAYHYDTGNDFFALWLDESLTYSCALWDDTATLEEAQAAKIDLIAVFAGVRPHTRVLDIGCGWGGTLRRLADNHRVCQAVGLTLSSAQLQWVSGFGHPRISACLESWEEHQPEQPYDAIVCVGALEHFAGFGAGRRDATRAYGRFFARARELLRPGGRLGLQTIVTGSAPLDGQAIRDSLFLSRTIFPESRLPRPDELARSFHGSFELISARNDPDHYQRTCREWLSRLQRRRPDAAQAGVAPETVATYEEYLATAARLFARGHAGLLRMALARLA